MEGSVGVGFMAVFAVSGSVVFIVNELHKRLRSDFMKKIEFELGGSATEKCQVKKRVRFADDVMEPSSNNKEYRKRNHSRSLAKQAKVGGLDYDHHPLLEMSDSMPLNRQVLYKGILEYKTLKTGHLSNFL